jgi:hypothetical protein
MVGYTFSVINTLEHDTAYGDECSVAKLTASLFAVAYSDGSNYVKVKTFAIDGSYNITEKGSLTLSNLASGYPSVCGLSATSFVVAYRDGTDGGNVDYCTCDADGSNISKDATKNHTAGPAYYNSICMISSTQWMLAYDASGDGYIKTFSISGAVITEEDSLNHNIGVQAEFNSLKKITANYYALSYAGAGDDGYLKTFSIAGGIGSIVEIDDEEFDTTKGYYSSLEVIDTTHLAVAYQGDGNDGYIKTFSIDGSADNITLIHTLEHDGTYAIYNSLALIDSTHLALAFEGSSSYNGRIKVFLLDGSYNISEISELEHEATKAQWNSLAQIDATHFFLAYEGPDSDGFVRTFALSSSSFTIGAWGAAHTRNAFTLGAPGMFNLVIRHYYIQAWGAAVVNEQFIIDALGMHDVGVTTFTIQAPGVCKRWERFTLYNPGLAHHRSSLVILAIGSAYVLGNLEIEAVGEARYGQGQVVKAVGVCEWQLETFYKVYRNGYRVENTDLEKYELYVGEDQMPDFGAAPAASGSSLPVSWSIPNPGPGNTVVLYVVPRKRNRFDLLSHNQHPTLIEVDEDLLEDYGPLTAPEVVKIMDGGSGEVMIHARYPYGVDRNEADQWELYAEIGTDPDPDTDTPILAVGFGAPGADYTWVGTGTGLTPGQAYKLLIVVRRLIDNEWAAAPVEDFTLAEAVDLDPNEGSMFAGQEYEIGD